MCCAFIFVSVLQSLRSLVAMNESLKRQEQEFRMHCKASTMLSAVLAMFEAKQQWQAHGCWKMSCLLALVFLYRRSWVDCRRMSRNWKSVVGWTQKILYVVSLFPSHPCPQSMKFVIVLIVHRKRSTYVFVQKGASKDNQCLQCWLHMHFFTFELLELELENRLLQDILADIIHWHAASCTATYTSFWVTPL